MKITYMDNDKGADGASWIRKLLLAWLAAAAVEFLILPVELWDLGNLNGLKEMSMLRLLAVAGTVFAFLAVFQKWIPVVLERWLMAAVVCAMVCGGLAGSFTWPFMGGCVLVVAVLVVYGVLGWNGESYRQGLRHPEKRWGRWVMAMLAMLFFSLVSLWTVARVRTFSTPTYDFGIFSQMFHSMKTVGLPITTVERDGPLSHFAVHVSPIYYLMLPFYWFFPKPETLQVLQAAVLASSVIPLWKLGRHHNLPQWGRMILGGILLLYPAYAGGASYDLHENCFLTPLVLWLLYGLDRRSIPVTAVAAALTLMVKEDAAVYVAVIGLYTLLRGALRKNGSWDRLAGLCLLAGAVGWFAAVTGYLARHGDGVMTYRYSNFMYDGSGSLVTVIKAVILCPMKAVFECVDPEKLEFIALTMLPLGVLPLMTRRYERYVLLIPYLLVNLMSDYQYQHDIFFQYTYGATGCLIYLTLVNVADIRAERTRIVALVLSVIIACGCFCGQIVPKVSSYAQKMQKYEDYYNGLRQVLDVIPDGASVASTTFYTTCLSDRDTLYDIRYASPEHSFACEYFVVGVTDTNSLKKFAVNGEKGYENLVALLEEKGYVKIAEYPGRLEIYQKQ